MVTFSPDDPPPPLKGKLTTSQRIGTVTDVFRRPSPRDGVMGDRPDVRCSIHVGRPYFVADLGVTVCPIVIAGMRVSLVEEQVDHLDALLAEWKRLKAAGVTR